MKMINVKSKKLVRKAMNMIRDLAKKSYDYEDKNDETKPEQDEDDEEVYKKNSAPRTIV